MSSPLGEYGPRYEAPLRETFEFPHHLAPLLSPLAALQRLLARFDDQGIIH